MNAVHMNHLRQTARSGLSVLSLQFRARDEHPDWPMVRVLVDGEDPFAEVAPDWRGFDPAKMLGDHSPLLPVDLGRRVAVYRCSCGEAGCGVIAPVIIPSPDGRRVSWVDFRDYVGVFASPTEESADQHEGRPWSLPDLHFDREQYVAEVERASMDDSWETPRRRTARLLFGLLEPMALVLPPDLELVGVSPSWNTDGITVTFRHLSGEPRAAVRQQILGLTSTFDDPAEAAEDMASRLLRTDPGDWARMYGLESGWFAQ